MIGDLALTGALYIILLLIHRLWHKDSNRPTRLLSYGIITVSAVLWFYYIHWFPDTRPGEWLIRWFEPLDPIK